MIYRLAGSQATLLAITLSILVGATGIVTEQLGLDEHRMLVPGMTFHIPPLCLKYREFGIGFSESIVVTETGCERLSKMSREVVIKN
jgi:Xaa-Pro aminopeptidase